MAKIMLRDYVLLNGGVVKLDYDGNYDKKKGIVRIQGNNVCYTSRRYGSMSTPYTSMLYDVRICIGKRYYDFSSWNMMAAEGMAVLGAYCDNEQQLEAALQKSDTELIGYAVSLCVSEVRLGESFARA